MTQNVYTYNNNTPQNVSIPFWKIPIHVGSVESFIFKTRSYENIWRHEIPPVLFKWISDENIEGMDNTYDQNSDKQKKLFIDTLENKLRLFQEQRDQMNKQEAEELP